MDKKGEIDFLTNMIKPDIGLITNISYAHIKNFKNLDQIAKAKAEIINNIISGGIFVANRDDNYFNFFLKEAKRKKIIEELVKRKYNVRGTADKTSFHLMPNLQTSQLSAGNKALGTANNQINYQLEQLRQKNKDRILGGNPHADTYTYQQIQADALASGGTVNPHELNFTASPQNYTSAQSQAGAGSYNQGNPHMMYNKKKKKYEKQYDCAPLRKKLP